MQLDPKAELTRQWLQAADEDLRVAGVVIGASPPLLSGAMYHCQQGFEKALKAFLAWHAFPLQRTHNLLGLVQLCSQIDASFSALAGDAAVVAPYATQFRYPPFSGAPQESDATDALRAARQAFAFTIQRLPPHTHP